MACYVLDTTVLSNFAHIRRPRLIRAALGEDVFTTPSVLAELRNGVTAGMVPECDWDWLQVQAPDMSANALAKTFRQILDLGESESLAVAIQKGCTFLSDDLAARQLAFQQGVKVSGTLGILIMLVKSDVLKLEEGNALLEQMISRGYRSPVARLSELF